MAERGRKGKGRSAPDRLRAAVEQTFEATAGSATETRERAGELLEELAARGQEARRVLERRGLEARRFIERRGSEARESSVAIGNRVADAIGEIQRMLRP